METIPTPMFFNYLTVESSSSSNPTFETNLQCQYNYQQDESTLEAIITITQISAKVKS